jgi:hypothetical protein
MVKDVQKLALDPKFSAFISGEHYPPFFEISVNPDPFLRMG